jgi:predicted DNA binding CopG/RHH family protein
MTTTPYVAADGTILTEDLVAELAQEAEAGLVDVELSHEPAPWHRKEPMVTRSVRIPSQLWALIEQRAEAEGMTASEYTRKSLAESLLIG